MEAELGNSIRKKILKHVHPIPKLLKSEGLAGPLTSHLLDEKTPKTKESSKSQTQHI